MKKLLLIGGLVLGITSMTACASFDSSVKDFESDTKGLNRIVTVYDHNGEIIRTYEGVIRTKSSAESNNIVFELNGKRISLYNVDVVIEEQ